MFKLTAILLSVSCVCLAKSRIYNPWDKQTTEALKEKATTFADNSFLDYLEEGFVDVWMAIGRDLGTPELKPRCSWTIITQDKDGKYMKHYHKKVEYLKKVVVKLNVLNLVNPFLSDPITEDQRYKLTKQHNGIIHMKVNEKALEYNLFPIFLDKDNGVIAYTMRSIAKDKKHPRLEKMHKTYISVKKDYVVPKYKDEAKVAVEKALEEVRSLQAPAIMNRGEYLPLTNCWGSRSVKEPEN